MAEPPPPYGHKLIPVLKCRVLEPAVDIHLKMSFTISGIYTDASGHRTVNLEYGSSNYQDVKIALNEFIFEQRPFTMSPDFLKFGLFVPEINAYKVAIEKIRFNVYDVKFFNYHEALLYIRDLDGNQIDLYVKEYI